MDRGQIVYTFSGVRPLPRHDATQPGFVSRDYRIERRGPEAGPGRAAPSSSAWWAASGPPSAPWPNTSPTTSSPNWRTERKISTAKLAIGGGAGFPDSDAGIQKWIKAHMTPTRDADRTAGLLTRYGTRAGEVISYLDAGHDRLLRSTRELSVRELQFMAAHEQVGHLVDVLIRRTSLAFRGLVTGELLNEVAEALAEPLGWDAAGVAAEINHAQEVLKRYHGVEVHSLVA